MKIKQQPALIASAIVIKIINSRPAHVNKASHLQYLILILPILDHSLRLGLDLDFNPIPGPDLNLLLRHLLLIDERNQQANKVTYNLKSDLLNCLRHLNLDFIGS